MQRAPALFIENVRSWSSPPSASSHASLLTKKALLHVHLGNTRWWLQLSMDRWWQHRPANAAWLGRFAQGQSPGVVDHSALLFLTQRQEGILQLRKWSRPIRIVSFHCGGKYAKWCMLQLMSFNGVMQKPQQTQPLPTNLQSGFPARAGPWVLGR